MKKEEMKIITFLEDTEHFNEKNGIRPRLFCKDGFNMSVQWSNNHHCDCSIKYKTVEIGMPSEVEPLLLMYAEDPLDDPEDAVYGFVPVEEVEEVIKKHGGLALFHKWGRFYERGKL